MTDIREVDEGTQPQGEDEQIVYTVTTTNWGSSPTSVAVVVKDSSGTDKTATVMPTNTPTVNGDIITLSPLKLLTAGESYRVEVKFTTGGNVLECYFNVSASE